MQINLTPKNTSSLLPTDILFQTSYWSRVKSCLGLQPLAFDIGSPGIRGDVLVLIQPYGRDNLAAYVPQGPECTPEQEKYGPFLEDLSRAMLKYLDDRVSFIRYDLPWQSRYAWEIKERKRHSLPEARWREMRMNMGTRDWNLKKASLDMTVASSVVVDIGCPEKQILGRMKSKTRYNIGLAARKGVMVHQADPGQLPAFYELYLQTATRNGFAICSYKHFQALFNSHMDNPGNSELLFLLATQGSELLAGGIIALSNKAALYLYGASSSNNRNLMAPYAMHWKAIQLARVRGCISYDMGAVSPTRNPDHPFYGLYRFKTGFGGKVEIRSGSWDYPVDEHKYSAFINSDNLARAWGNMV